MRKRPLAALVVGALVAAGALTTSVSARADLPWAPAGEATIHPGVQMFTDGAQCTANFVYTDGADTYIGYAAHCAGTGGATETDGCLAESLPLGTPVEIDGASELGTLAYSSWLAMQAADETDPDACAYNDLALVRIHPGDVDDVNPSVPHWGGPVGLDVDDTTPGELVYGYGNSSLRLGLTLLSPKTGISLGTTGGWTHPAYTLTPGIPGDSGSALLSSTGQAAGILSTLVVAPLPASNNYSDLANALDYMHSHGGPQATVVNGTEPFDPNQLPLAL